MKVLIGISFILLILAALNPSKDDYETYCKKLVEKVDNNSGIQNNQFNNALKTTSVAIFINSTERDNYYIFSTFKTKIAGYEITRYGFLGDFSSGVPITLIVIIVVVFFIVVIYYMLWVEKLN